MPTKSKVMIVEDEAIIAMNLRCKLEGMGFDVAAVVDNGRDALQTASETHPDLVMMDIVIHGNIDGIETAHLLRDQQDVPVIFLTAHTDESTVNRAKAALPYGYLSKPFEENALRTSIEMAIYRHQADALRRLQNKAIDSANSAIVVVDAQKTDWPVVLHNPAFENIVKREGSDVAGKPFLPLLECEGQPKGQKEIEEFLEKGVPGHVVIRYETNNGQIRWIDTLVDTVSDSAGLVTHYILVLQDVTNRANAERLARRYQHLETVGTLTGGVAHDLNNALAPIMMCMKVLKTKYPDETEMVDMILLSAKRGADMVRQLLSFAKGAEGKRVSVQVTHLIVEISNLIKKTFPENIELYVDWDNDLPPVEGDATQLHQVLLNLCINARDAMPDGGKLKLEGRRVEMDEKLSRSVPNAVPGTYVTLRVSDNGSGIPPKIIDRIFEPFFSTKVPEKGTGLGLPTVQSIVQGHGGFIHVLSQPEHGSTFNVYLPYQSSDHSAETHPKAGSQYRGNGELILLVDDEAAMRQSGQAVLQHLNFKALTATDGADGLIKIAAHLTELRAIITDLNMPLMGGLEFIRNVRKILPEIPVLLVGGRIDESKVEAAKALGTTSWLEKPYSEEELAEALEKLLVDD